MTGRVLRWIRWYTPADCRAHPDTYFVFGDNLAGWGKAGQACIRGEPNAIGVPTKISPTEYFTDTTPGALLAIDAAFDRIEQELRMGHDVVVPAAGLGTGLAQMPRRAPRILAYIRERIRLLEERYPNKDT